MRNSSLVEWRGADNVPGLKPSTEAADARKRVVGERSHSCEVVSEGMVERWEVRMPA